MPNLTPYLFLGFVLLLLSTGCRTAPWEPMEDPNDAALLFRVSSEIKLPDNAELTDYMLLFWRDGDPWWRTIDHSYDNQSDFPNNPLLIKLPPGTWRLYQAAFTISFGDDYSENVIRSHIKEPPGYELEAGQVLIADATHFTAEVIPRENSRKFKFKTRWKRKSDPKTKLALIEDAIKAAGPDNTWIKKLIKAKLDLTEAE